MKIEIICEGGSNGVDRKVYEFLARKISPDVKVVSIPLDSKPNLIDQCGKTTKALLELDTCERVIIIWDLQPAWKRREAACRSNDCHLIRQSLQKAQLDEKQLKKVHLVCMEQELETLFLTDEHVIAEYLTQKSGRSCIVKSFKYPQRFKKAKEEVDTIFRKHSNNKYPYKNKEHADKLIQFVTIKKLRRCASFVRFAIKITDEHQASQLLDIPLTVLLPQRETK